MPLRLFPSTCLIRQDVILQEIAVTIYFFLFIKCETSYIYYYFTFYSTAYIKAAAALCVVCLITDIAATILTGLGLRTRDHNDKYKYYRFAVYCMAIARKCHIITIFLFVSFFLLLCFIIIYYCISVVCLLIALVIYPICFAAELNLGMVFIIDDFIIYDLIN